MMAASKEAGLGETAIRDIMRDMSNSPRLETLQTIAVVLNTSVGWLVDGSGEKVVDPEVKSFIDLAKRIPAKRRETALKMLAALEDTGEADKETG